jgi:DNA-binding transcriptional ArsR family regulator
MGKTIAEKAKKTIEEAVQYAVGHEIRVYVLILLNEGIYTAGEISEKIDVPLNTLHNHLRRMLDDGSIEIADQEKKGNMTQYKYRAVEAQIYTVEEFEKLPFEYQQNIVAAIFQSGTAEGMAGLYAGKLADPRATVFWDWFNLDAQGRKDADALTERYVEELREIECEATNRVANTKEETTSMLANLLFFERPRKGERRCRRRWVTK